MDVTIVDNTRIVDPAAAVEFASMFGPPNVMAFKDGRCLHPEVPTTAAALSFIETHADADIYFCPAALRDAFVGKPKKSDCLGSGWAWVDIDPPKGMRDPTALELWRENALAEIDRTDVPAPQIVVSSGRGLWLFWRLSRRAQPEEIEAINFALAGRFGGGDSCHNIDRVARTPSTRNSKTGEIATVLRDEPSVTQVEHLPTELPPTTGSRPSSVEISAPARPCETEDEFREIVMALRCDDDRKESLLQSALDPQAANDFRDLPLDLNDRSAVMFSWCIKAIMTGMEPAQVRDCILSPAVPHISGHLLDPRKVPLSARERAAMRQVQRAAEKAAEFGWTTPETTDKAQAEATDQLELISLAPVPDDLPARPWLVEGLLLDGQVTMLTGRGGEGKSLLALQLAIMTAMGGEFAWWSSRQRRNVLVLNAEDNIDEQRRRLLGACRVMDIDHRMLDGRLFASTTERLVLVHRDPDDNKIKTAGLYEQLAGAIEQHEIGLVVIDPLVEAHVNLDENSNDDMKELILVLRNLARRRRIPILVVHHSRKGATGGDQDGARGGSALVNACRIVLTVDRMTEEEYGKTIRPPLPKERYVRVTGAKANYAGRIGDRWMELVPCTLPNGDETVGFRRVVFGEVEEGFDPKTWEHKDEVLRLVATGRGGGKLWSTATTGRKEARLDGAISDRFKQDTHQARSIIERLEQASMIRRVHQRGDDRKPSEVWVTADMELPAGTAELPF